MELISRVKAILRRTKSAVISDNLSFGEITLDLERHICIANGVNTELTYKEYEMLRLFLNNAGIVLTRETIMNGVWGTEFAGESRTIDAHIKTLRKKLGTAGEHIITVRNVGYKLE